MTHVPDTWEQGSLYEQYVGRWSRLVAPVFLSWLAVPDGRRWLDVGCGTGALSSAILDQCSPSSVVGVEPSEGFLRTARDTLGDRVVLHQGSADDIPLPDSSVDAVVSGLVLNFVPDRGAALAELVRVTSAGGTIGAYVWDYAGRMDLMRQFWAAAVELDSGAAALDEGVRFSICDPDALVGWFRDGGLVDAEAVAIDIPTPFASFDDYWRPFLGGQGSAPSYAMSLDEPARVRLRERLRERIPVEADGSIPMIARAWAVRALVP